MRAVAARVILHADMDAFYASVEQRDHPELRGKPVIVGAASARGVVSAASYEARKFGVHSAMPGFQAKKLCPEGVFLSGDMRKYARVSRQVQAIFRDFTDQIEPLSLDEAFLDITGSLGLFGSAEIIGRRIKERVRKELDLPISIGIAPNKLVAKIACGLGKPDGFVVVGPGEEAALLAPLPIGDLFGVGPKTRVRLEAMGLRTIGAVAHARLEWLTPLFGKRAAELQERARGQDDRPVVSGGLAKSIGEESTFPDDVTERERIISALSAHADAVAARARRAGLVGDTVTLKVKLARRRQHAERQVSPHELFPLLSRQKKCAALTCDSGEIRRVALLLWDHLALGEPVRLLGVSLSGLAPRAGMVQEELFGGRAKKNDRLGQTLDAIAERFGPDAVHLAALAPEKVTWAGKEKLGELVGPVRDTKGK